MSADARRGYFSGVREETFGDKDLYIAHLPERPVQIILLKGRVLDNDTDKPLATLIKVYDNNTKELIYVLNSNGVNGRFSSILPPYRNYNVQVEVEQPGYSLYSVNINIPDQKEFVEIDTTIRLQREGELNVITLLPNIFFKLDLSELDSTSELELDALAARMFKNPKMHLEIAVHTFSQKNEIENMELSQKRAEAIVQALVNRGVEQTRLFPVGYGQQFPNDDEKTLWADEGVKPKDRSEAIIIPATQNTRVPAEDGYYYLNEIEPFYLASGTVDELIVTKGDTAVEEKVVQKVKPISLPSLSDLKLYFIVNKIYFRLDPDSVLDEVIRIMNEQPSISIKINCYTDTVGHPDYNLFLSQIRADNVKKEMIKRGADPERIITVGHGEKNPIYSNATREGRKKNRRAEFEAISPED